MIVHKPPNHCNIDCHIKKDATLEYSISVHTPFVVTNDIVRKIISFIFSSGNIKYNGIAPIIINTNQIIKIDKTQVLLSICNLLSLLFDIYTVTKIKIDANNNSKKGIKFTFLTNDQNMATIALNAIIICEIRIKSNVC
jgi:hypothetical protein